jgi:mannosyltransferase OCH1-like enzyme
MRRGVLLFAVVNITIILFLINQVWTLLGLLVADGSEDAITKAELPARGSSLISERPQIIPKILHQTYKNASIPPVWQEAQASCLALHQEPDWQYKLWTDEASAEFIKQEYEWFYDTFMSYPYPIQRADAIRYFVLAYYGGVYLDLDDGCNRELEPLLSYPAWVRKTIPTGISNDAMGAVPGHPFFLRVINDIQSYNRNWLLPYITVMGSTGPLFLSVMWRHWKTEGLNVGDDSDGGRIRIIFPEEYVDNSWSFFTHHLGNSWHGADVRFIFWMAQNWVLVTLLGFVVGFGVLFGGFWVYHRYLLRQKGFEGPVKKTAVTGGSWMPWRRGRRSLQEYELVSRHEV